MSNTSNYEELKDYVKNNTEQWKKQFPRIKDIQIEPHPSDVERALDDIDEHIKTGKQPPKKDFTECIVFYVDVSTEPLDEPHGLFCEIIDLVDTKYEAVVKPEIILEEK